MAPARASGSFEVDLPDRLQVDAGRWQAGCDSYLERVSEIQCVAGFLTFFEGGRFARAGMLATCQLMGRESNYLDLHLHWPV